MSKDEFTAREPSNDPVPLLIGLVGPSSSGKTYTALRLATGVQRIVGGDIHVLDTETGRARHYRKDFKFKHVDFAAPYSSPRYAEAIKAQVKQGASVVIVDSLSHEHENTGGYLEYHEAELDRLAGDDWQKRKNMNFLAWAKPAASRRALINTITSLNAVFIFCFRAKEKLIVRKGQEPLDGGWAPISGDEFVYEMTLRALLPPGSNGVPEWKPQRIGEAAVPKLPGQFRDLFEPGEPLQEKHGEALARWARGETAPAAAPRKSPPPNPSPASEDTGPFDEVPPSDGPTPSPTIMLIGRDGKEFHFPPDKWAKTLIDVFEKKPFDFAETTWRDNKDHIEAVRPLFPDHAIKVEAAWLTRQRAAESTRLAKEARV